MFEETKRFKASIDNIKRLIYQENKLNHLTLDDTTIHMSISARRYTFHVSFVVSVKIVDDKLNHSIKLKLPFNFEDFKDQTDSDEVEYWEMKHKAWVELYSSLNKIEKKKTPKEDASFVIKDILKRYDAKKEEQNPSIDTSENIGWSPIVNVTIGNVNKLFQDCNNNASLIPIESGESEFDKPTDQTVKTYDVKFDYKTYNDPNGAAVGPVMNDMLTSGSDSITNKISEVRSEITEGLQNLNSSVKDLVEEIRLERQKPSLLKRFIRRFLK